MTSSSSKILDTHHFKDILKLINHESGILLDLDNTIMESEIELGSDQWFVALMDHACKTQSEKEEAIAMVIAVYQAIQHHVRTKPVEPGVVRLIKTLQDIGFPVLGITARDKTLINTTHRQLHEIHIDFSRNRGDEEEFVALSDEKDAPVYHRGIIFCNGQDKGKCLKLFLEKCGQQPNHFVMADDKIKHLQHVKQVVESLGKRFDGIRYSHLDQKVLNLNMKAANQQLAFLRNKLPATIQTIIDRLNIVSTEDASADAKDAKHTDLFAKDPFKRVLKRKQIECEEYERNKLTRPSSALSLFAPKRRKIVTILSPDIHEQPAKIGMLKQNS